MNDNTKFFSFKMGSFNESKTCIKSNIGLDVFTIFPKDGDYYIRFNRENEGVFTFKFNGNKKKFYDRNFGLGVEYYYGEMVNFRSFVDEVELIADNNIIENINKSFKSTEGFDLWGSINN